MRLARSYLRSGRGQMNVLIAGTVAAAALALVSTGLSDPATAATGLDRRTMALSALLQIVGAGFVANGAAGALYGRRHELATLRALGWPRFRLHRCLAREFGVIALAVGLLAVAVSYAAIAILGGYAASGWPLLAMPAAVALAFAAAWWPLRRATARPEWAAMAVPSGRSPARTRRGLPMVGQAVRNLRRFPGRTVLAALMIAVACAALGLELIVRRVLDDVALGAWLGRPASPRANAIDIAVVLVIVAVTIVTVADLNSLTVGERAGELRTLRAIGWSARSVGRLVVWEAVLLGLLGGLAAGVLDVAVGLAVLHRTPPGLALLALVVAGAGVVVSLVAVGIAAITQGHRGSGTAGELNPLFTNGFPMLFPWPWGR
jgi:putative ABC transport system permease protein